MISMIPFISLRRFWFTLSGVLVLGSALALIIFGLKPGIDFTGGSLIELEFLNERPAVTEVQDALAPLDLGTIVAQGTGDEGMILRLRFLSEEDHQRILSAVRAMSAGEGMASTTVSTTSAVTLATSSNPNALLTVLPLEGESDGPLTVIEKRFETIGPSVSAQLRGRAIRALIAVVTAVILYIAYSFRRVSRPIQSWKYGVTVVVALVHDVLITAGVFAILGRYRGVEVDISFAVALLTIMGYSMNNSIIVFDRVRENLIRHPGEQFSVTVNNAINESLIRTVNSSFMTLLVLIAIYAFGGQSIHYLSLALIVGVVAGTYSAMFLASPLLVVWERFSARRKRV